MLRTSSNCLSTTLSLVLSAASSPRIGCCRPCRHGAGRNFRYSSRGIEEHRVTIRRILLLLLLAAAAPFVATRPAGAEMLSAGDQAIYRMAFKAVEKGKWDEAHQLAGMAKNPLPAKVIEWLDLIRPGIGRPFEEISAFMQANP